jgi:hypothetical protein
MSVLNNEINVKLLKMKLLTNGSVDPYLVMANELRGLTSVCLENLSALDSFFKRLAATVEVRLSSFCSVDSRSAFQATLVSHILKTLETPPTLCLTILKRKEKQLNS